MNEKRMVMMKDETLVVSSFFLWEKRGGESAPQDWSQDCSPKDCSPQKFSKKFFRVGVWGGFEWVGGIGNSGWDDNLNEVELERGRNEGEGRKEDLWSVLFWG